MKWDNGCSGWNDELASMEINFVQTYVDQNTAGLTLT